MKKINKPDVPVEALVKQFLDQDFRDQLRKNPKEYLCSLGYELDEDMTIIVRDNTREAYYVTLPDYHQFKEDFLENINAAGDINVNLGTASTIGTASTASTIGTVFTTASTAICVLTYGTAGSLAA